MRIIVFKPEERSVMDIVGVLDRSYEIILPERR